MYPTYVIYVDELMLWVIANFVFDLLLLWATRQVSGSRPSGRRLALMAALGAGYSLIYRLSLMGLIPGYGVFRSPLAVLGMSVVMLSGAFLPVSAAHFLRVAGYFYLIGFLAGGVGLSVAMYMFGSPLRPNSLLGAMVSVVCILLVSEIGWGVVQKEIWDRVYRVPVRVSVAGKVREVTGLIDTGNQLRDPITATAVVVVEATALVDILPEQARKAMPGLVAGDLDSIADLSACGELSTRLRLLPFASVGNRSGLLLGLRSDYVAVRLTQKWNKLEGVIIGLHGEPFAADGSYQALVPPEILRLAGLDEDSMLTDHEQRKGQVLNGANGTEA